MTEPGIDEAEEFEPTPDPSAAPEDYDPEVIIDDPTREANPVDVNEQTVEVPHLVMDEDEEDEEEPSL